jgi:type IV secretory pathway VirB10-like protein
MLKDGVVLMVICLIVVGGLAVWWTQTPTHPLEATAPQVQEPAPVPAPAPVVKRVARPKPAPPPVVEQPVAVAVVAPPPAPAVQRAPMPFPAVEQIASGAHVDAITTKYGDPALAAVTSTGGHMVETFVYSKDRGRNATVIRLEDGKVATAYSQAEPMVPPGLSAPRRVHAQ